MKYIRFIRTFFNFFGTQNDFLYPFDGQINDECCQFKKSHWYKTRIGFTTAWKVAKTINL